jgi:hypothetical protein
MTAYIGIDPGANGGIVLLTKEETRIWKMPENTAEIYQLLFHMNLSNCHVLCESQHGRPAYSKKVNPTTGQEDLTPIRGATAIWTFAQHYGELRGILVSLGANYQSMRDGSEVWERDTFMSPRSWMKLLGIEPRSKDEGQTAWKGRLWDRAKQLYPHQKIIKSVADAVLIAHVCRIINMDKAKKPTFDFGDI